MIGTEEHFDVQNTPPRAEEQRRIRSFYREVFRPQATLDVDYTNVERAVLESLLRDHER